MTPKEKAEELVHKFMPHSSGDSNNNEAKICALISVDEIIKILISLYKPEYTSFNTVNELMYKFEESDECDVMDGYQMVEYYEQVKQEIEKI